MHPPCLSLQVGGLAALPRPLRPRHAAGIDRRERLDALPKACGYSLRHGRHWPQKQKEVTPHRGMTSCPLLPKQVRYHAAPRSVMGCFVRKRPCFGKGGPSGGRKGRCLHEGGTASCRGSPLGLLPHRAGAGCGQGRPSSPQKGAGHACPSLRTGKEQGLIRARAPDHGHRRERWSLSRPQPGGRKRKTPLESGGISLWGERWDLNPRPPGPQPGALPTELLPP